MKLSAFFKNLNDVIEQMTEYFDTRVVTGKFVGDVVNLNKSISESTKEKVSSQSKNIASSEDTKKLIANSNKFLTTIEHVPVFGTLFLLFIASLKMLIRFYADIFIVFAMLFPMVIVLAVLFSSAIQLFFLLLFPIVLFHLFSFSALFLYISDATRGEQTTLIHSYHKALPLLRPLAYLFSFVASFCIEIIIGYVMISFFYSFLFTSLGSVWNGSFIYWFVVVFLGLCIGIILFIMIILFHIAFFLILFDHEKIQSALLTSWYIANKHQLQFYLPYFLFISICYLLLQQIIWHYLFFGIGAILLVFALGGLMLGYLLYKRYYHKELILPTQLPSIVLPIPFVIIFFGVINILLLSFITIQKHDTILQFVQQQQTAYFLEHSFTKYTSAQDQFSIEYPKDWTVYERKHSVTMYNNYTGTLEGGVWLTIDTVTYKDDLFLPYYNASPGRILSKSSDDTITYKIAAISVNGHKGVHFTQDQTVKLNSTFKTVYLIKKDAILYQITFTAKNKNTQGYSYDTIDKVINSLKIY